MEEVAGWRLPDRCEKNLNMSLTLCDMQAWLSSSEIQRVTWEKLRASGSWEVCPAIKCEGEMASLKMHGTYYDTLIVSCDFDLRTLSQVLRCIKNYNWFSNVAL